MRRRLGACHADSHEEYLQKLKAIDSLETKSQKNPIQMSPYNISCAMEALPRVPYNNPTNHSFGNNYVDEFAFRAKSEYETDVSNENAENSSGVSATERLAVKTIIVGSKDVRRHSFVHSLVPGEVEDSTSHNSLDLVVKTKTEENREVKYHFWIKDCDNDQEEVEKFKGIYKVYYNFVSSLIFMYSVSDRESFNLLKKSVEEIKRTVGLEGFKAILIGLIDKDSQQPREVDYQEGEGLMQEEGFAGFLETDSNDISMKEKALSFLCNRAESHGKKKK